MIPSLSVQKWLRKYSYLLAFVGIILYNNWLIGIFVNWPATKVGATTSELSVSGQPCFMVFRLLDVVAGIFLILGAIAITNLAQKRWQKLTMFWVLIAFALSMIFDVIAPLDCSSALSQICAQKEQLGLVSWLDIAHMIESPIFYALLLLLPFIFLQQTKKIQKTFRWLTWLSWALLLAMPIWGVETALRFMNHAAVYGFEQRGFDILFTAWFAVAIFAANKISRSR